MMRFEFGLEKPDPKRAPIGAATIAISYLVGGLIPLRPYMLTGNLTGALKISVLTTGVALLIFGAVKGHYTGVKRFISAGQTLNGSGGDGPNAKGAYRLAHAPPERAHIGVQGFVSSLLSILYCSTDRFCREGVITIALQGQRLFSSRLTLE